MNGNVWGQSRILYVEDDDATRPVLQHFLRKMGYLVAIEVSEENALHRAGFNAIEVDLILVHLNMSTEQALAAGRRIRLAVGNGMAVPLVVIADRSEPGCDDRDINVHGNDWITYMDDSEQLKSLFRRALSNSEKLGVTV
jgi:CheY-like chemotaxis protein